MIKKEIIINSDVKKVWKVFCKMENWPKWGYYVLSAKWLSNSKWKTNSKFIQKIKSLLFFKIYNSKCRILKIKKYRLIEWEGTRKLIQGVHSLKFKKIGNKTKFSNMEYFKGPLAPLIYPLIKKRLELYYEKFNKGLKREAEK